MQEVGSQHLICALSKYKRPEKVKNKRNQQTLHITYFSLFTDNAVCVQAFQVYDRLVKRKICPGKVIIDTQ